MTWPEEYLPFTTVRRFFVDLLQMTLYHSWRCLLKVCVSHVFPSLQMMCLLTFFPLPPGFFDTFFCESLKVVWRCSNICLVDSISFLLFSFLSRPPKKKRRKNFSCKTFLQQHSEREKKYANCSGTKKRNREFCHVVLLLIMEQNAEIPFAKAILQYTTTTTMFHLFLLFFLPFFTPLQCEKISPVLFSRVFPPVVSCFSSSFVRELNLLHRIAFGNWNWIFILFAFQRISDTQKPGKGTLFFVWIEVKKRERERVNKIKLCQSTLFHHHRLAKVTFN